MSRKLPGTLYHTTGCEGMNFSGDVNVFLVSDRLEPIWRSSVGMTSIDFIVITAACNWGPYLALMLVTAIRGDFAADDRSVGLGPY